MSVDILPTEQHRFYVDFELRPEEDRAASIEQGMPVFKDVEFAIITMPGGGLVVDKEITPDLLNEWKRGGNRKPASPFALQAYEAWKEDREIPLNGTDLANWPGVTPAQLKMCRNASVRTIEDLALANADTLRRLGMGSVALVEKAKAYLASAETNKSSEAIAALTLKVDSLTEALEKKNAQIEALMDQLEGDVEDTPKKRGRPRKQE